MGLRQFIFAITIIFFTLCGSLSLSQETSTLLEEASSYIWILEDSYGGCSVAIAYTHEGLHLPINPERCSDEGINCPHPLARLFLQSSRQIYTELNPADMSLFSRSLIENLDESELLNTNDRKLAKISAELPETGEIFENSIEGLQYISELLGAPVAEVARWNYLRVYMEIINKIKNTVSISDPNLTGSFDEDLFKFADFFRTGGIYSLDDPLNHFAALKAQLKPEALIQLVEEMMMTQDSLVESSSVSELLNQRSRLYWYFQRGILSLLEEEYQKYDNSPQVRIERNENWARVIANNHLHQIGNSDLVSYTGGVFHFIGQGNLMDSLETVHRFKTRALSFGEANLILNYLRDNNKIRSILSSYDSNGDGNEEIFTIEALDRLRHEGFPANQAYCFKDVLDNL